MLGKEGWARYCVLTLQVQAPPCRLQFVTGSSRGVRKPCDCRQHARWMRAPGTPRTVCCRVRRRVTATALFHLPHPLRP